MNAMQPCLYIYTCRLITSRLHTLQKKSIKYIFAFRRNKQRRNEIIAVLSESKVRSNNKGLIIIKKKRLCVRLSLSAAEYHNLCMGGCKIGNGQVNRPWCRDRRQFYKWTITGKNTGPIQLNEKALTSEGKSCPEPLEKTMARLNPEFAVW